MIDFHSHILPNVDHGSDGLSTSLKQLQLAKEHSITTIVATSHFYPYHDKVDDFLKRRDAAYDLLCQNKPDGIDIIKGAEVMLMMDLDKVESIEKLCIDGTHVMLVEMPDMIYSSWIYDVLLRLRDRGISPVIAHIDRYPDSVAENLLDMDLSIQVNAYAFKKLFKRRRMVQLAQEGRVHVLGSDIHGANKKAYKDFLKAKAKLGPCFDVMQKNAKKLLGI